MSSFYVIVPNLKFAGKYNLYNDLKGKDGIEIAYDKTFKEILEVFEIG